MQVEPLDRHAGSRGVSYVATGLIIGTILTVRLLLNFHFPVPWPDETSFIAPAFQLARHGTLFVSAMNPDRLVMWMPPAYFFFLAGFFKVFGYSFGLVRWTSAACVAGSAFIFRWLIQRSASGTPAVLLHAATVAAFLSPYVVMSANIGRMEALLSLVMLASLVCCIRGVPVLGAALVASAATIHFNAVYFTLPYISYYVWLLMTRRALVIRFVELAGVFVSAAIVGAYAILVRENVSGFLQDMHFQFETKRFFGHNDPLHPFWPVLVAGFLALVVFIRERKVNGAIFVALYGVAFVAMAAEGKEIWYECATPMGFLLILVALFWARPPTTFSSRPLSTACAIPCMVCLVVLGYAPTPTLTPLLPTMEMLAHPVLPARDIRDVRKALGLLPEGATVTFAWGGVEPFFLDALDKSAVRWVMPQHSVTEPTIDRHADWLVQCDSDDVPENLRRLYPRAPHDGQSSGCDLRRP